MPALEVTVRVPWRRRGRSDGSLCGFPAAFPRTRYFKRIGVSSDAWLGRACSTARFGAPCGEPFQHAGTERRSTRSRPLRRAGRHRGDRSAGILAIAAVKLGAEWAVAFDHDPWSQQNAIENFYLNQVDAQIAFRSGSIDQVPEEDFDLILANINRKALLAMLPVFAQKTRPGGHVVLAGLLQRDRARMLAAATEHGLVAVKDEAEGEWWAVVLAKNR